jgi:GTPase SAR1 family protein
MLLKLHDGQNTDTLRLILVGEPAVGKSTFVEVLQTARYADKLPVTVAFDLKPLRVQIRSRRLPETKIRVHLFDMAGMERTRATMPNLFHHINGVIFAYDLSRPRQTLLPIFQKPNSDEMSWLEEVWKFSPNPHKLKFALIGFKRDLLNTADPDSGELKALKEMEEAAMKAIGTEIHHRCSSKVDGHEQLESVIATYLVSLINDIDLMLAPNVPPRNLTPATPSSNNKTGCCQ